jgi:hypothetical protein
MKHFVYRLCKKIPSFEKHDARFQLADKEGVLWRKCRNHIHTTRRYKVPKAEATLDRESESMKSEKEIVHL